jgi:hypothetical protein
VSSHAFDYTAFSTLPKTYPFAVPALPSGKMVQVRQDWRVGELYAVADGDTQVIALCDEPACPDESIRRSLERDVTGSGSVTNARASAAGEFLAMHDDGESVSVFDLRRESGLPVLTLPSQGVASASFGGHRQELFILNGDELSVLPFGPREIAARLKNVATLCLSPKERRHLFDESAQEADNKHAACAARRAGSPAPRRAGQTDAALGQTSPMERSLP